MKTEQISFQEAIRGLSAAGWRVLSDGPTGVQMEAPKKMRTGDKVVMSLAIFLLFVWAPIGVLILLVGVNNYAFFTKPETKFFPRQKKE